MYFSWSMTRTITSPIYGVTFTREEELEADKITKSVEGLPIETINTILSALGAQIVYLDQVEPWTTGDKETQRAEEQKQAAIAYKALNNARTLFFIREKMRPESWAI